MTTPTSPIPTYPPNPKALLVLLLEREKYRLLGPVVTQAVVSDPTRAAEAAQIAALEALDGALGWVERADSYFKDNSKGTPHA